MVLQKPDVFQKTEGKAKIRIEGRDPKKKADTTNNCFEQEGIYDC